MLKSRFRSLIPPVLLLLSTVAAAPQNRVPVAVEKGSNASDVSKVTLDVLKAFTTNIDSINKAEKKVENIETTKHLSKAEKDTVKSLTKHFQQRNEALSTLNKNTKKQIKKIEKRRIVLRNTFEDLHHSEQIVLKQALNVHPLRAFLPHSIRSPENGGPIPLDSRKKLAIIKILRNDTLTEVQKTKKITFLKETFNYIERKQTDEILSLNSLRDEYVKKLNAAELAALLKIEADLVAELKMYAEIADKDDEKKLNMILFQHPLATTTESTQEVVEETVVETSEVETEVSSSSSSSSSSSVESGYIVGANGQTIAKRDTITINLSPSVHERVLKILLDNELDYTQKQDKLKYIYGKVSKAGKKDIDVIQEVFKKRDALLANFDSEKRETYETAENEYLAAQQIVREIPVRDSVINRVVYPIAGSTIPVNEYNTIIQLVYANQTFDSINPKLTKPQQKRAQTLKKFIDDHLSLSLLDEDTQKQLYEVNKHNRAVYEQIEGIVGTSKFQKLVDLLQEITEVRLVKGRSSIKLLNYYGKARSTVAPVPGVTSNPGQDVVIVESNDSSSSTFVDQKTSSTVDKEVIEIGPDGKKHIHKSTDHKDDEQTLKESDKHHSDTEIIDGNGKKITKQNSVDSHIKLQSDTAHSNKESIDVNITTHASPKTPSEESHGQHQPKHDVPPQTSATTVKPKHHVPNAPTPESSNHHGNQGHLPHIPDFKIVPSTVSPKHNVPKTPTSASPKHPSNEIHEPKQDHPAQFPAPTVNPKHNVPKIPTHASPKTPSEESHGHHQPKHDVPPQTFATTVKPKHSVPKAPTSESSNNHGNQGHLPHIPDFNIVPSTVSPKHKVPKNPNVVPDKHQPTPSASSQNSNNTQQSSVPGNTIIQNETHSSSSSSVVSNNSSSSSSSETIIINPTGPAPTGISLNFTQNSKPVTVPKNGNNSNPGKGYNSNAPVPTNSGNGVVIIQQTSSNESNNVVQSQNKTSNSASETVIGPKSSHHKESHNDTDSKSEDKSHSKNSDSELTITKNVPNTTKPLHTEPIVIIEHHSSESDNSVKKSNTSKSSAVDNVKNADGSHVDKSSNSEAKSTFEKKEHQKDEKDLKLQQNPNGTLSLQTSHLSESDKSLKAENSSKSHIVDDVKRADGSTLHHESKNQTDSKLEKESQKKLADNLNLVKGPNGTVDLHHSHSTESNNALKTSNSLKSSNVDSIKNADGSHALKVSNHEADSSLEKTAHDKEASDLKLKKGPDGKLSLHKSQSSESDHSLHRHADSKSSNVVDVKQKNGKEIFQKSNDEKHSDEKKSDHKQQASTLDIEKNGHGGEKISKSSNNNDSHNSTKTDSAKHDSVTLISILSTTQKPTVQPKPATVKPQPTTVRPQPSTTKLVPSTVKPMPLIYRTKIGVAVFHTRPATPKPTPSLNSPLHITGTVNIVAGGTHETAAPPVPTQGNVVQSVDDNGLLINYSGSAKHSEKANRSGSKFKGNLTQKNADGSTVSESVESQSYNDSSSSNSETNENLTIQDFGSDSDFDIDV